MDEGRVSLIMRVLCLLWVRLLVIYGNYGEQVTWKSHVSPINTESHRARLFWRQSALVRDLGVGITPEQSNAAHGLSMLGSKRTTSKKIEERCGDQVRYQDCVPYAWAFHDFPFPPASRSKCVTSKHSVHFPWARGIRFPSLKHLRDNSSVANVEMAADVM